MMVMVGGFFRVLPRLDDRIDSELDPVSVVEWLDSNIYHTKNNYLMTTRLFIDS